LDLFFEKVVFEIRDNKLQMELIPERLRGETASFDIEANGKVYGKYFEKLILGSLFTILGFEYEENLDENIDRKCFTLSLRSDD
ncbi:hypothetical protein MJI20_31270, partial [Salmonella enterica subsp. enterica serovar Anatum]|nr:hypothetical protein [Salmonella enterica subsp. enterica serovar Anatum]